MKYFPLLAVLFFLASCATPMTTPPFGVPAENAWFLEQDTSSSVAKPIYCMADVRDGKAHPKCYRSRITP